MSDVVRGAVHRNSYRDSVELMGIAAELERLPGIARAGLVMATPANLAVLAEAGLSEAAAGDPGPNDLVVAVLAGDGEAADAALARAAGLLTTTAGAGEGTAAEAVRPQTLAEGLAQLPDANLALVSTPGTYATAEALRALKRGLHVFLFSDNVPIEDEIELKRLAERAGLLVMGPDCGTAIVAGVPLGFANAVRRGEVGIVAASGTGLQQVSCLVHRAGLGVSHALGTGGRDLDERVGGRTMLAAIDRLLADEVTRVLVLISKPPAAAVAEAILERVRGARIPVVVNFLGGEAGPVEAVGAHYADTFEAAARRAVELAGGTSAAALLERADEARPDEAAIRAIAEGLPAGATIRGLYSGGSLAGETKVLLRRRFGPRREDRILDLGDDEYTVGRPHPMIDPRLRVEQILAAGRDATVGVVLLDVVLGYASHEDPAGALADAIVEARETARRDGRTLAVVASVCGTDEDPQDLGRQEATLREAGVLLAASNARAAALAGDLVEAAGARAGAHLAPTGKAR